MSYVMPDYSIPEYQGSYTLREYKGENLCLYFVDKLYRGYKFFIKTYSGNSVVAFDTKRKLKHWLKNRNLTIGDSVPFYPLVRNLKGNFCEDFCWSNQELKRIHDEKNGKYIIVVSNGEKTRGVSYISDNITHILCCNPNVADRPKYNWFETEEETLVSCA